MKSWCLKRWRKFENQKLSKLQVIYPCNNRKFPKKKQKILFFCWWYNILLLLGVAITQTKSHFFLCTVAVRDSSAPLINNSFRLLFFTNCLLLLSKQRIRVSIHCTLFTDIHFCIIFLVQLFLKRIHMYMLMLYLAVQCGYSINVSKWVNGENFHSETNRSARSKCIIGQIILWDSTALDGAHLWWPAVCRCSFMMHHFSTSVRLNEFGMDLIPSMGIKPACLTVRPLWWIAF